MRRPSRTPTANWKATSWKAAGLAAVLGVTATGVAIARAERQRRGYTPQEIRDRLHARHADAIDHTPATLPDAPQPDPPQAARPRTRRWSLRSPWPHRAPGQRANP
jgi:hypothetical protein